MPFIEHLSQLSPGDVRTRQRRAIVIFARAIPYLYGLVAVLMALVLTGMMVGMGGMILVGTAQLAGFDPASVAATTWRWLVGGAALLLALFLSQNVAWARQGWVRWLARSAEVARLLGLALMALVLGGIVGASRVRPSPPINRGLASRSSPSPLS